MLHVIKDLRVHLCADDILRGQGIDPNRASKRLFETAASVVEFAEKLLNPAAIYTVARVTAFEHRKISFKGGFFEGSLVAKAMAGADELTIGICTIGEELENEIDRLMGEDPITAIALDGAGIAALRKVSNAIEDMISSEACQLDLALGMRAQPGQEGWPIEQQREVFKVLPAEQIGVHLTESCLMIPRKSVSFVVPRGKDLDNSISPCDICSKRDRCEWRKEKLTG